MDSVVIKKKRSENIDYSFQSKMQRFLIAALLTEGTAGIAIDIFFQNRYFNGIPGLGPNFQSPSLIWGNSIGWNGLHFFILIFISGIFGFLFGYMSRKVSMDDKVLFGTLFVFFHFFFLGIILLIADIIYQGYWTNLDGMVSEIIHEANSSRVIVLFLILDCLGMVFSAIFFMKKGRKIARNSNDIADKNKKGKFLGIKLYHYIWLCIPIIFYSQVILNFLYQVTNKVVLLIVISKKPIISANGMGGNGNANNVEWGNLLWLAAISGISIFLMVYLQKILSGKIKKDVSIAIVFALGIGFVVPLLILLFTPYAG
jgi:hypothetical protein